MGDKDLGRTGRSVENVAEPQEADRVADAFRDGFLLGVRHTAWEDMHDWVALVSHDYAKDRSNTLGKLALLSAIEKTAVDVEARAQELFSTRWPGKAWNGADVSRSYWRRKARNIAKAAMTFNQAAAPKPSDGQL
jgi:hypothetical protein